MEPLINRGVSGMATAGRRTDAFVEMWQRPCEDQNISAEAAGDGLNSGGGSAEWCAKPLKTAGA